MKGQSGFSLVAVIFLIVVLAALGAFAVQVAMTQYQGSNLELLQARAQAAAEAGIEYDANLALQRVPASCLASNTLTLRPTAGALAGFVVQVTCTSTTHQIYIAATPTIKTVYALSATASEGSYGTQGYVTRTVTRNVTDASPCAFSPAPPSAPRSDPARPRLRPTAG
jgi:MSHA biogenesis protein MshP